MRISPSKHSPQYPILAATLAGAAALTLSACTCTDCGGSGLQIKTPHGPRPCMEPYSSQYPKADKIHCRECEGTGTTNPFTYTPAGILKGIEKLQQDAELPHLP